MSRSGRIFASIATLVVCLFAAGAAYTYYASLPSTPLLNWTDKAVVARGKVLYASHCAGCHGAHGEGQAAAGLPVGPGPLAPPHDETGHTWQHPDFALIQVTKSGESTASCRKLEDGVMPKFQEALTDRDILDVLSYIKSKWPAETIKSQEAINRLYQSQNKAMWDVLKINDNS